MVTERERAEQEKELDRRIDLINVIFGAALGGYIGDVLGQETLDGQRGLLLSLALVILVCLLVAIRNLVHVAKGTHKGSWKIPAAVCLGGIVFFYAIRGDTYLDIKALLPVVIGWAAAFAIVISSQFFLFRNSL